MATLLCSLESSELIKASLSRASRYEIATSAADEKAWEDAERQVREAGNSTVVSIKSQKKRKVADVTGENNGEVGGDDEERKKGKKEKDRGGEHKKKMHRERHREREKDGGKEKRKEKRKKV